MKTILSSTTNGWALLNIEALAQFEHQNGVAEKKEKTQQFGPYAIKQGERVFYAYEVVTTTDCFDIGIIDCTPGVSISWVEIK